MAASLRKKRDVFHAKFSLFSHLKKTKKNDKIDIFLIFFPIFIDFEDQLILSKAKYALTASSKFTKFLIRNEAFCANFWFDNLRNLGGKKKGANSGPNIGLEKNRKNDKIDIFLNFFTIFK